MKAINIIGLNNRFLRIFQNTPGTRDGSGFTDRMLAAKSRKNESCLYIIIVKCAGNVFRISQDPQIDKVRGYKNL